ncbi:peptidylprolyl isomerase [Entamoeba marina]
MEEEHKCQCGDECCDDNCDHCDHCEDDNCGHCDCGCEGDNGEDDIMSEEDEVEEFDKEVITEGTGYEKPIDDCVCIVDYTITVHDETVEEVKDFTFTVGDVPVICSGFEKGVESMKLNEVCTSGSVEHHVGSNEVVNFKVTLKSMKPVPSPFTIEPENIVAHAQKKKAQGNELVKKQLHERAIRAYKRALDYLDNDYRIPEDFKTESKNVQTLLYSNIAAMYLHLKQYKEVVEFAGKALENDGDNVKALMRRGKAQLELGFVEEAEQDFNKKKALEDKKDKQRYAKMFGALGSFDEIDQQREKQKELEEQQRKEEWEKINKTKIEEVNDEQPPEPEEIKE